nr:hypothetical protein Iba_chr13aCG4320 [Ipomoea batatas]
MVFATSLEDNVAYINKELIIIHYWNVKNGSPRKCRFSLASMCHGMTLSAFVGRVIDFLIGVGDQLRNPREEPQAKAEGEEPQAQVEDAVREEPQDSVGEEPLLTTQTFHVQFKCHQTTQTFHLHKTTVIDFLIGVGDQLRNPREEPQAKAEGEEPQAQVEDAVREEPQDSVGEEPLLTTQTFHGRAIPNNSNILPPVQMPPNNPNIGIVCVDEMLENDSTVPYLCLFCRIVCVIVSHDNKIKSGLLALNVLLSVMIPFISILKSSREDRFSHFRRDFRRIVTMVFATSLEDNVAYINKELIIIHYWNVKNRSPRKCRFSLASMCHGMTLSAFVGRVIDFLIGVGDQLRNPREEPQAKAEGEEPQAQVEDAVREEPQDSVGEEPHLTTQTFHGHRLPEELVTNYGILGKSHKHKQGAKSHKHKVIDFLIGVGDQLRNPREEPQAKAEGEEPQAQVEDAVREEPQDSVGEEPHLTTQTFHGHRLPEELVTNFGILGKSHKHKQGAKSHKHKVIDFLIGVGDQLRNPREEPQAKAEGEEPQAQVEDAVREEPQDSVGEEPHGHRLPEELVTNYRILGKSHKHKQGAKSHKHKVIDFLIGVGDQLLNLGEEPQAQADDAVGEEPQDAVGEEPHLTTQTFHVQFKCHQTTKTFYLHQTTVIDFLIGVGDQLQNPGEEPQAQAEDAVGEEPQDAVGEEPHQTTQTIHLQVIDFLIGVGDQLMNPREEPQAKAEGEEPQAQVEDAVREEQQDSVGEEPHLTTQTFHPVKYVLWYDPIRFRVYGHRLLEELVTNYGILGKSHKHKQGEKSHKHKEEPQAQAGGEEPQAQVEDVVREEAYQTTQTFYLQFKCHQTTQTLALSVKMKCLRMIQLFLTFACFAVGIVCVIVAHDNKTKSGLLALNVLLSVIIPFISVLICSREDRFSHVRRDFRRIVAMVFATSLEDNVEYINMGHRLPEELVTNFGILGKSHKHKQGAKSHKHKVIDFLIGVGDQLQNPGEEPQAQAEDAVGEEPQDAVGEEPHQTTQTIHLHFACFAIGIVCVIVAHDNKIKTGLLALHVLLSVMIPFISILKSSREDRFSHVRRDFRRIVTMVFATSLEDNVAYINKELIIIHYWNVKNGSPRKCRFSLASMCHGMTLSAFVGRVIDFLIGVGDQLRNPREEPQAKAEGEEPQAQVEDAVREEPQDSVGEEPHLTTQTFHVQFKCHQTTQTFHLHKTTVIDFLIGVGDQLQNPGEEPQAQAEDAVGEEPQDAVGEEPHQTTQTIHLQVIDFLIGVGDQLLNLGEEPQAQADDAVGEEPQDAVGEKPYLTTQTFHGHRLLEELVTNYGILGKSHKHKQGAKSHKHNVDEMLENDSTVPYLCLFCRRHCIVCVIVAHDNKIKSGLLALNVLLSVMIPFISVLKSSREDRFSHVRRDFRRIVAMVFATSKTMWRISTRVIDFLIGVGDQLRNPREEPQAKVEGEEPQAQDVVGEEPQDAFGEELEPEEHEPIIPFQQAGVEAIHVRQAIILVDQVGVWTLVALLGRIFILRIRAWMDRVLRRLARIFRMG